MACWPQRLLVLALLAGAAEAATVEKKGLFGSVMGAMKSMAGAMGLIEQPKPPGSGPTKDLWQKVLTAPFFFCLSHGSVDMLAVDALSGKAAAATP